MSRIWELMVEQDVEEKVVSNGVTNSKVDGFVGPSFTIVLERQKTGYIMLLLTLYAIFNLQLEVQIH